MFHRRYIACAVSTLVITVGLPVALSTPAAAHLGHGCVTKSEYERAKLGMTKGRVGRIWGTHGDSIGRDPGIMVVTYDICGPYGSLNNGYKPRRGAWRLTFKGEGGV